MKTKDKTKPTLSQYQAYNGEWYDCLDEQHYLDTVAKGNCRVRALYAAPQPVIAPTFNQFLSDVLTAAGLIKYGKQSKTLANRLAAGVVTFMPTPQPVTAPEPTLRQYQKHNGHWADFIDEQHWLDTVAEGRRQIRELYAAPQPVIAPAKNGGAA